MNADLVKSDRVQEVRAILLGRKYRKDKHILVREDRDGTKYATSAVQGFICQRCHKSEDEIMECKNGDKCETQKARWAKYL